MAIQAPVIQAGAAVLSGILGALDNGDVEEARRQIREAQRQFDANFGQRQYEFGRTQTQSEGNDALGIQRSLDATPLRDMALHSLRARMAAPPSPFQANDRLNPTAKPMGSPSDPHGGLATNRAAAASYTPGAGGADTSVARRLLEMYMNNQKDTPKMPVLQSKKGFQIFDPEDQIGRGRGNL